MRIGCYGLDHHCFSKLARKSEPLSPFSDAGHLELRKLGLIFVACLLKIEIAGKSLEGPTLLIDIQEIIYSFILIFYVVGTEIAL
jgi:hypothetical protein